MSRRTREPESESARNFGEPDSERPREPSSTRYPKNYELRVSDKYKFLEERGVEEPRSQRARVLGSQGAKETEQERQRARELESPRASEPESESARNPESLTVGHPES